ncbi:Lipase class 3-related protein [Raphanus sativus]|uniref:GDSL esterase/lipase At4g10955-like n=1 Tax=Raphanus sativus TaxID=3726 RepID=A0A9W3CFT3_RAPSA|nr:GDSL esterase/lipase At4g10955-like [Raphanus sativus]KAJ4877548.1 Lipase class 3-related protein [Raphanus sativus]
MLKFKTWRKDLEEDLRCLFNNLSNGTRFKHAIQTIETVLEKHSTKKTSVWLTGHSLGAGIALLAGKTMTKRGFPLETYVFSPPISSIPLERLSGLDVVKDIFRFAECIFKVTLSVLFDLKTKADDSRIAKWIPYVYVNPSDIVCAEYIGLLKHKNVMADFGLSEFEILGAGVSIRSLVFGDEIGEPIQLLSSADMTVNKNKPNVETNNMLKKWWYKFKKAHALAQWWDPNPDLRANWETHSIRPSIPCLDMEPTSSS